MPTPIGPLRASTISVFALAAVALFATGCPQPPALDTLEPSGGQPGRVIEVEGTNLDLAAVVWDAGRPTERIIPSSFLGSKFFTVPPGVTPGLHPVQLLRDGDRSSVQNFNVTGGVPWPDPSLDDVTASFIDVSGGNATILLMAHGANIDVGSTIQVDGADQVTEFSRLLENVRTIFVHDPATLGYPIFHWATVWCVIDNQTPGDTVSVRVRNINGATSNALDFDIPSSNDEIDRDGDGLLDDWEENGYDADGDGTVDVDLPALGADPLRKDLFVEVDWMQGTAPDMDIWTNVEDAFDNAPILNSDGSQGIAIHIDRGAGSGGEGGDAVTFTDLIRYDDNTPLKNRNYENFFDIKSANFDSAREDIFRYCLFANDNGHSPGFSGRANNIPGRDFFVTLETWGARGMREDYQTGTFMHELGHTLNLRHGGFENANEKDNYNSIMQYGENWVNWNGTRQVYSPSQFSGIDDDCDPNDVDGVFTFSTGERADLDELDLDENEGVCDGVSIDWDGDGMIESSVVANVDEFLGLRTVSDHDDWGAVQLPLP
jgi:hypothetical protein